MWSYDKAKRFDNKGNRWHFVSCYFYIKDSDDEPYELYFRDEEKNGIRFFEI